VAASFDPARFAAVPVADKEVILLRVVGTSRLPQDSDLVRTKLDHFQRHQGIFEGDGARDYDDLTLNQLQFSGLECRILGTFFVENGSLWLGSDLESFAAATRLNVYKPRAASLGRIVNYVNPIRQQDANNEALALGLPGPVPPFRIGTVVHSALASSRQQRTCACAHPALRLPGQKNRCTRNDSYR
jgi:hypothetical protein